MCLAYGAEDTCVAGIGAGCFQEDCPCAVAVDHTVAVVRVDHAAQGLGAYYKTFPGHSGPDKSISIYQPLKPTWTAKEQVIGDTSRIDNLKSAFYPAGQAGYGIALEAIFLNVAKVVRHDQLVDCLRVDAGIFDRGCSCDGGHV